MSAGLTRLTCYFTRRMPLEPPNYAEPRSEGGESSSLLAGRPGEGDGGIVDPRASARARERMPSRHQDSDLRLGDAEAGKRRQRRARVLKDTAPP